ncbi:MAG: low-specificity L-threonine aldolase [Flavobacteriales bacterium]
MIIDLRSDTVTKPSKAMLDAMLQAAVGDDVFSEDPTVNELEKVSADMFGMEAGLYCSSGTQTNQVAIKAHTQPGMEVICSTESHIYRYEGGGVMVNSGCSVRMIAGNRGMLKLEDVSSNINNPDDVHLPLTSLVSLENTSNRGGGAVYPLEDIKKISVFCKEKKLSLHLDGARLFNALIASGVSAKEMGSYFDSISICLSKGLGAPIGSVLLGKSDFIKKSRRVRKVFGGGMRQAGIIAAAGLFVLKNNVKRLHEDHLRAQQLAKALRESGLVSDMLPVETNIVIFEIDKKKSDPQKFMDFFKTKDIHFFSLTPGWFRWVTHLDYTNDMLQKTVETLKLFKP